MNKKTENLTLKEIMVMPVESDTFFDIFCEISDKYWDFKDPDMYQKACFVLHQLSMSGEVEKVVLATQVIATVFDMYKNNHTATSGHLAYKDKHVYFDIYETEVEKDKMHKHMHDVIKSIKDGKIEVKKNGSSISPSEKNLN